MKFSFCNEMFEGWKWEEICRIAREEGYAGIEVAPYTFNYDVRDLGSSERSAIYRTAKDYGLDIVGTHWLLVRPGGMNLFSEDPKVSRFTADYLLHQVDFCADIGGKVLTFGSPNQRNVPEGMDREEAEELFVEVLRRVGDRAVERGVKFCVEPLPPSMTNLMETVKEAVRIAAKADHPGISFMLDVKSVCAETKDVAGVIMKYSGMFDHFHANDSNMKGPGFGDVDFVPIMQALEDSGYKGFVSLEAFDFDPDPLTIVRKSLAYMKACEKRQ